MLYLNIGDKETAEEQFGIYHIGEGLSLKTISSKLFVMYFLVPVHFTMQLEDVILARELLKFGKFTAQDKLYFSKCFMLSRFIFLPEPPLQTEARQNIDSLSDTWSQFLSLSSWTPPWKNRKQIFIIEIAELGPNQADAWWHLSSSDFFFLLFSSMTLKQQDSVLHISYWFWLLNVLWQGVALHEFWIGDQ